MVAMPIGDAKLKDLMGKHFKQCIELNILGMQSTGAFKLPGTIAITDALLSNLNKAEKSFLWVTLRLSLDRLDEDLKVKGWF